MFCISKDLKLSCKKLVNDISPIRLCMVLYWLGKYSDVISKRTA